MNKFPYTYEDSPECWQDLDSETRQALCTWIDENILPRKTPYTGVSSYGLKHYFQRDTGRYVFNEQFKMAMKLCGYKQVDADRQNWHYCISKRSPALEWNCPRHKHVLTHCRKEEA